MEENMKKVTHIVALLVFMSSCFLTLTFLPENVRATTLYVGGTGIGNYTMIQGAIDDANPGDTVYVYNGTYYEHITIDVPLSLVGEDRDITLVNGTGTGDVIYVTADWVNITGFTATDSGSFPADSGVELYYVENCRVANNRLSSNGQNGLQLRYSSNNTIVNNSASDNSAGIYLVGSNNNTVRNNTVSNNSAGIMVDFSKGNLVAENNISHNSLGLDIFASENTTAISNFISRNRRFGIIISHSFNSTISDNVLIEDGMFMSGFFEHWNSHIIETSNTVNGKPVYYWKNIVGGYIPADAGQVILANCSDVVVENLNVSTGSLGIELGFSSRSVIANNTASWNDYGGIVFYNSDNNIVTNNSAVSSGYSGISLRQSSHNNTFTYNNASSNIWRGILIVGSDDNTVINNTVSDNYFAGIYLDEFSNDNIIAGNNISDNERGIHAHEDSSQNRIYHNILIDNTLQAFDDSGSNEWDNGYPSGGNYWSDYSGVDEKSGPNQNEEGSDGMGDTPYDISGGASEDRYPLMNPVLESNNPPTASFTVTPLEGNTTTIFIVDASTSSDPEDPTISLEFKWDCENDGAWDSFFMTSQCQYSTPGTYTVRLEVRDTGGRMDITTRQVIVRSIENQQPTCSISEPEQGDVLSENYTVIGTASDSDGVVEEVEIRIDDGPWIQVTGTSSWSYEWNTTDVSDGNHTIYARSYDGTDYSEEVSVTVVVDSVSPPPPAEEESVFEQAWFWITVAVVIVIILTVVLILVRRRKEKQGEGESPESG